MLITLLQSSTPICKHKIWGGQLKCFAVEDFATISAIGGKAELEEHVAAVV